MLKNTIWRRLRDQLGRLRDEERGDVVNWLIITLGVAIAAAAVITVLQPAIESAGQQIANLVGG
jgi:uncharacterized membrane protein